MILDQNLVFCTNQSHAGAAAVQFTDTVDLSVNRDLADGGGGSSGRHPHLFVTIAVGFTGATSVVFQLFACQSTTINIVTPPLDQVVAEATFAISSLTAGMSCFIPFHKANVKPSGAVPVQTPWRYLIGQMTPTGTLSTGTFSARLAFNPTIGSHAYPTNLTIL